jgi:hypothetical protein
MNVAKHQRMQGVGYMCKIAESTRTASLFRSAPNISSTATIKLGIEGDYKKTSRR